MARKMWLSASGDYWDKQRCKALVRDDFRCQFHKLGLEPIDGVCTEDAPQDRFRALQVHHIIPRTNFLPHEIEGHDLGNLITVCKSHHEQIHPHMRYNQNGSLKKTEDAPARELPAYEYGKNER